MSTSLHLLHQQCNPSDHHPSPGWFKSLSSDLLYLLWLPVPCLLQNIARMVLLKHKSDWVIHFPYLKCFNGFPATHRIKKKPLKSPAKICMFHPHIPHFLLSQQTGILSSSCLAEHLYMLVSVAIRVLSLLAVKFLLMYHFLKIIFPDVSD